jgi:hypothetical protein
LSVVAAVCRAWAFAAAAALQQNGSSGGFGVGDGFARTPFCAAVIPAMVAGSLPLHVGRVVVVLDMIVVLVELVGTGRSATMLETHASTALSTMPASP